MNGGNLTKICQKLIDPQFNLYIDIVDLDRLYQLRKLKRKEKFQSLR